MSSNGFFLIDRTLFCPCLLDQAPRQMAHQSRLPYFECYGHDINYPVVSLYCSILHRGIIYSHAHNILKVILLSLHSRLTLTLCARAQNTTVQAYHGIIYHARNMLNVILPSLHSRLTLTLYPHVQNTTVQTYHRIIYGHACNMKRAYFTHQVSSSGGISNPLHSPFEWVMFLVVYT